MSQQSKNKDDEALRYTEEKMNQVIIALEAVSSATIQTILDVAKTTPESEVIQYFNQSANDLFTELIRIMKKYNFSDKHYNIAGYQNLFNNAISVNVKLPIDKFTLTILLHAADIYDQNEQNFLDMKIPDTQIKVGNEFAVLSSGIFKEMWRKISKSDRESLKDVVISLTMHSHTYFIQKLMMVQN